MCDIRGRERRNPGRYRRNPGRDGRKREGETLAGNGGSLAGKDGSGKARPGAGNGGIPAGIEGYPARRSGDARDEIRRYRKRRKGWGRPYGRGRVGGERAENRKTETRKTWRQAVPEKGFPARFLQHPVSAFAAGGCGDMHPHDCPAPVWV